MGSVTISDDQLRTAYELSRTDGVGWEDIPAMIGVPIKSEALRKRIAKFLADQQAPQPSPSGETAFPPIQRPNINNRSCIMDIEVCSPAFGRMSRYAFHLLCCSFLPLDGKKPYTLKIDFADHRDDQRVFREVMEEIKKFQFIIGHNIKGYDLNWINTRLMMYDMELPPRIHYYDTYQALKRNGFLHSKSLGHAIDFMRLPDVEKTKVMPFEWDRVNSNFEADFNAAMKDIVYHCEQDVLATRELYNMIYARDKKPSWTLWTN